MSSVLPPISWLSSIVTCLLIVCCCTAGADAGSEAATIANCPRACNCVWDTYYYGVVVHCAGRGLRSLPLKFPSLTSQIDASNNSIASVKRPLPDMPKLTHLNLNRNMITDLPKSLGNLPSLQNLGLEGNRLGSLSADLFRATPSLQTLNLADNNLDFLPAGLLTRLANLKSIDLRGGNFGLLDTMPAILNGCPSLVEVYLDDGNTKRLIGDNFKNSKNLGKIFYEGIPEKVDFAGSDVVVTIVPKPNTTDDVTVLSQTALVTGGKIRLSFKQQPTFAELAGNLSLFENATELSLAFTGLDRLTTVGDLDLGRLRNFGEIVLAEIPLNLGSIVKLLSQFENRTIRSVTISNTKLMTNSSRDLNSFNNVDGLTDLDLSLNTIRTIDPGIFEGLKSLRRLLLQSTGIQALVARQYLHNERLEIIDLSGNGISSFDFATTLNRCPRLRELYISHNALRHEKPVVFPAADNLMALNLDYNQLTGALDFRNLKGLERLSLEGIYPRLQGTFPLFNVKINGLDKLESINLGQNGARITPTLFNGMTSLRTLILAGNALVKVKVTDLRQSFVDLKSLKELDLSGNGLVALPSDMFKYLKSVSFVNLADNKLLVLETGLFKPMTSLLKLNIAHNVLATISRDTITEFRPIKDLQISANSFRCECDLRPFRDWLQSSASKHRRVIGAAQLCTSPIDYRTSGVTVDSFTLPWVTCDGNGTLVTFLIVIPIVVVIAVAIWRFCRRRGLCRRRKYLQFDDGSGTGTIRF
ncbi:uncharacterized protein LOC141911784 [Tubulanus polymorphus]|uniref:uncharacterized protein LOC141911784 n=1 Tax=Tubulanus polymorphus TaxID=672921 RepID=UPI003DA6B1CE